MKILFLLNTITFAILCVATVSSDENTTAVLNAGSLFNTSVCKYEVNCPYIKVGQILPQNESCCKNLTKAFECSWRYKMQLLRYLNLLKSWNCSEQIENECSLKTFNFNDFSEKAYLSVCDPDSFNSTCSVKDNMSSKSLSSKQSFLKDSCVAVNSFYRFGAGNFVEVLSSDIPMCPIVWCGFHNKNVANVGFSYWDCAPQRLFIIFKLLVCFRLNV